ncbi:MAG: hypothetical protein J7K68_01650 [Candidatus Diapherotrites archaeon]|nr:hypothetical protein [Candidatus Diapherotrites archaeon]
MSIPENNLYKEAGKSFVVGTVTIAIALVIGLILTLIIFMILYFFWKPLMVALLTGTAIFITIFAFLLLWMAIVAIILYIIHVGTFVRYFGKTTEVSKERKNYSLTNVEEAGMRTTKEM